MHLDLLQIHQFSQIVCKSTSFFIDKIVMLRWIFFCFSWIVYDQVKSIITRLIYLNFMETEEQ